jgi:hypothetical protein
LAGGLAGLAGCAGVFDTDRDRSTVNPALRDTSPETDSEAASWRVDTPGVDRLSAGDGVIVAHERGSPARFRGLSTTDGATVWTAEVGLQQSVTPGDVLVSVAYYGRGSEASTRLTGIDTATGSRVWRIDSARQPAGLTDDTVVLSETRATGRTVAYDRRDATVRWRTPPGERNWFPTTDPVVTFTGAAAARDTGPETATATGDESSETTVASETTATPPTGVTPAPTTDDRPLRLQGRDTDTGRLVWSVAVPTVVGETVPAVVTDDRLFATDGRRYFLFDTTTGRLLGDGALPTGCSRRSSARGASTSATRPWTNDRRARPG